MYNLNGIENIIFDLGGVVIDLDLNLTLEKWKKLSQGNFNRIYSSLKSSGIFEEFEKGEISGQEFIDRISEHFPLPPERNEIKDAWISMLLDFPPERAELLKQLKTRFRTFLLSNTNEIHLDYYFARLKEWYGVSDFSSFFHKEYYSCNLNMRKPDPEIFEYVLKDSDLEPSATLFIDDGIQNIESAQKLGLHTIHLNAPETIIDIFSN